MKKLKLIYNPNSGNKFFKNEIDNCLQVFQEAGYEVSIFRTMDHGDIQKHFIDVDHNQYDSIVVSGGDGTINIIINCMMVNAVKSTLGIIPSGTANDFATFLKIPSVPKDACKLILDNNKQKIDIGKVNDVYFINVCAAGLFTNVSQRIDVDFKNTLGKLGYYLDGVKDLPNFIPIPVRITNTKEVIEEKIYLLMVLNTSGTGGFNKLCTKAKIDDGLFDFVLFKVSNVKEMAKLFVKTLSGDYFNNDNVIYFKDNYIKVEIIGDNIDSMYYKADIDGEEGPEMPIEITCIHKAIEVLFLENGKYIL